MPQQTKLHLELNSLNSFKRGPPKEHSDEVILKLVHCFRLLSDGRTEGEDDARRMITKARLALRA